MRGAGERLDGSVVGKLVGRGDREVGTGLKSESESKLIARNDVVARQGATFLIRCCAVEYRIDGTKDRIEGASSKLEDSEGKCSVKGSHLLRVLGMG